MAEESAATNQDFPTPKHPWSAHLLWAKDQNCGTVSMHPNRAPVATMLRRIANGEPLAAVAEDFDVQQEALHVAWQLRQDILDAEQGILGEFDVTEDQFDAIMARAEPVDLVAPPTTSSASRGQNWTWDGEHGARRLS